MGLNNENGIELLTGMNRDVPIPTDESEETDQIVGGTKVDSPKRFPYMVIFSILIGNKVLNINLNSLLSYEKRRFILR